MCCKVVKYSKAVTCFCVFLFVLGGGGGKVADVSPSAATDEQFSQLDLHGCAGHRGLCVVKL